MKFIKILVAIELTLIPLVMNPVYAEVTIVGYGMRSCGAWTEARKNNKLDSLAYETWVQGFLSGINSTGVMGIDILESGDHENWLVWIDNYCQQKPLDKIYTGVSQLADELLNNCGCGE